MIARLLTTHTAAAAIQVLANAAILEEKKLTKLMTKYPDVLEPIETASRDALDAHQAAAIAAISKHAYKHSPLIGEVWKRVGVSPGDIGSIASFREKAPFITKDDIRTYRDTHNDPRGGMSVDLPGQTVSVGTTSGTTGDPTPVPNWRRTPADLTYSRDFWHIGARPGDYLSHVMFTYRGGHRRRGMAELGMTEIAFSISPDEIPRIAEASKKYRPTIINVFPSPVILMFEQYFEKTGDDPKDVFKSYKGAIFGGEPLSNRLKALTASWGLEIFETTSLGDVAGAVDCRAHDGFHAYEDVAFIETIDPITLEPIPAGEIGELVVTSLVDHLSPLVRYRTGDLVVIDRTPCTCGRTHNRFKLLGRASDQILVQGRSILPRELMGLVELEDETRANLFQIVRTAREMDRLHLKIGYDASRLKLSEDDLRGRLHDRISAAVDVPLDIDLVDEQELLKLGPPHKIPRVTKP